MMSRVDGPSQKQICSLEAGGGLDSWRAFLPHGGMLRHGGMAEGLEGCLIPLQTVIVLRILSL